MLEKNGRPVALASARAEASVFGRTAFHTTDPAYSQHGPDPTRIRRYRIDRWLTVLEVMR